MSHNKQAINMGDKSNKENVTVQRTPETAIKEAIQDLNNQLKTFNPTKKTLADLDLFVLDNSLRETTVGQLRGHTLENKMKIYEEVKRVGFKNVIVESFNNMNRLGEPFIRDLINRGEDMSDKYAFTEMYDALDESKCPKDEVPIGLIKMKEFGIKNVIMEFDLEYFDIDYTKFTVERICNMLSERFKWIRENLAADSKIFVNLRDFSECMLGHPQRLFHVVHYLSSLPEHERIFGLAYEEGGRNYPEQLAVWTSCVRNEMNKCGWNDGHFIVHVHEQFGMANIVQLECLANGATGIWAGLCEEGAAMGHASSCNTIINLVRMGNQKVIKKFNCSALRTASRAVTEISTGAPPHAKQPICGDRALDVVFSLDYLTRDSSKQFNLSEFLGEKPQIRLSNMSSPSMILEKLKNVFGDDPNNFTLEIAEKMKEQMLKDLNAGVKEEYHSRVGLSQLYDRAGGKLTEHMADIITSQKEKHVAQQQLIDGVRKIWNEYDLRDGELDDELDFNAFYDGFMAPHFGCYRCEESRKALSCIDMDADGKVDWKEFAVYLKWAVKEYPEIGSPEELISVAFNKGIKPAMHDEILKQPKDVETLAVKDTSNFYAVSEI